MFPGTKTLIASTSATQDAPRVQLAPLLCTGRRRSSANDKCQRCFLGSGPFRVFFVVFLLCQKPACCGQIRLVGCEHRAKRGERLR